MKKPSVIELKNDLEALKKSASDRQERISAGEVDSSDCFLSEWANHISQNIADLKIRIAENDFVWGFQVLVESSSGNVVAFDPIKTKYGYAWITPTGWVGTDLKPETLENKGYRRDVIYTDAWVSNKGHAFPILDNDFWDIE